MAHKVNFFYVSFCEKCYFLRLKFVLFQVLVLFWNLAHSEDICTDVMDVALANHIKILDYSCCQDRDAQKILWLDK